MGKHDKMGDEFIDKWDGHPNQNEPQDDCKLHYKPFK